MELYDLDTEALLRFRTKEAVREYFDELSAADLADLAREQLGLHWRCDSFQGHLFEALLSRVTQESP